MRSNSVSQDLKAAFSAHPHLLKEISQLRGAHLFVTGGTGFFGCWLLEGLDWFHRELGIEMKVTALSRNPDAFRQKNTRLAQLPFLKLHAGDVRDFAFPEGEFTHVIHSATDASAKLNAENPLLMFETITSGTRRALDFAVKCGAKRFLLTSSGAVYGRQPPALSHVSEEYAGGPDPMSRDSAYGEGKRVAEYLCSVYAGKAGFEPTVCRAFAFLGPYLPLDAHFAVGNFVRDAIRGGPIRVGGDGTPVRSYLYGADLVAWLWGVLLLGRPGKAYNLGSEEEVSIAELARTVARAGGAGIQVEIGGTPVPGRLPDRYVPSTQRARGELGLKQTFNLEDSLRRMIQWHTQGASPESPV